MKTPVSVMLLDIEGTTTAIDFVHTTLFGVAVRELPAYVAAHWESPETEAARQVVAREKRVSVAQVTPQLLTSELVSWVHQDRKETSLKALQGKIWNKAYERGELKSHVYPDVPAALQ